MTTPLSWARDRLAELDSTGLFRGAERDIDEDYGGNTAKDEEEDKHAD